MIMNYTELEKQIKRYATKSDANQDFLDSISFFIEMGQQRIWRELTGIEFEKRIIVKQFQQGEAFVPKPVDWNKTISFAYGDAITYSNDFKLLKPRTYEVCRAYWPNANKTDSSNPPEFYADATLTITGGAFFYISPTPDQAYKYELTYLKRVGSITKENTTNILTDSYPDLLFYACFLEALAYLRDDERIQIYEANYQRALASAMQKTTDRHVDRTVNRDVD